MDATTGTGPLHRADGIDWRALVPEGGAEIPALLRDIAAGGDAERNLDDAVAALYDLIRFPGPGYLAAPAVADVLVDIACHPDTPAEWRSRPLSLLLEILVPNAADLLPWLPDIALWRDEVAWAAATDIDKVREQYWTWREEAPDEQQYRRMRNRLDAVSRDNGPALLQAELAVHDTVRARATDLVGLLDGRDNRRGIDPPAEWACYLLAFIPEAAEEVRARLMASLPPAPGLQGAGGREAPGRPRQASVLGGEQEDVLSAELFALGMLTPPDDPAATVALAHEMASGHLYNAFAAAVALTVIHGEKAPRECLTRITAGVRTRGGANGLFGDSWPHCGEAEPEVLGFLALGRGGEATRETRLEMLPGVIARAEGAVRAIVAGDALEMAFGPRTGEAAAEAPADIEEPALLVLWAIAELPAAAWAESDIGATVEAWGLPADRAEFRAFAGVDGEDGTDDGTDNANEDTAAAQERSGQAAPPATAQRQSRGLFSRLFGADPGA